MVGSGASYSPLLDIMNLTLTGPMLSCRLCMFASACLHLAGSQGILLRIEKALQGMMTVLGTRNPGPFEGFQGPPQANNLVILLLGHVRHDETSF